jgi:hypothetical protein
MANLAVEELLADGVDTRAGTRRTKDRGRREKRRATRRH